MPTTEGIQVAGVALGFISRRGLRGIFGVGETTCFPQLLLKLALHALRCNSLVGKLVSKLVFGQANSIGPSLLRSEVPTPAWRLTR